MSRNVLFDRKTLPGPWLVTGGTTRVQFFHAELVSCRWRTVTQNASQPALRLTLLGTVSSNWVTTTDTRARDSSQRDGHSRAHRRQQFISRGGKARIPLTPRLLHRSGVRQRAPTRHVTMADAAADGARGPDVQRRHRLWLALSDAVDRPVLVDSRRAMAEVGIPVGLIDFRRWCSLRGHSAKNASQLWSWAGKGTPRLARWFSSLDKAKRGPGMPGWCRYAKASKLWFKSAVYNGICQNPSHPRVRMWNFLIACYDVMVSRPNPSPALRLGKDIIDLRRKVAEGETQRPPNVTWDQSQDTVLGYDVAGIVYAFISKRGSKRVYVGATSQIGWDRMHGRVQDVTRMIAKGAAHDKSQAPHMRYLANCGTASTMYDHVLIPLEHVPKRPRETGAAYIERIKPWERWWINALAANMGAQGWNVQHTKAAQTSRQFAADSTERSQLSYRRLHNPPRGMRRRNALHGRPTHAAPMWYAPGPLPSHRGAEGDSQPTSGCESTVRRRESRRTGKRIRCLLAAVGSGTLDAAIAACGQRALLRMVKPLNDMVPRGDEDVGTLRILQKAILDAIVSTRVQKSERVSRSLLVGGYIGHGVEQLRLGSVVASEEVQSLVPQAIWSEIGRPLVVFKYSEPLARHVCNWGRSSRNTGLEMRQCACHRPQMQQFVHAGTGHVVTKDLRIVRDPALRELLSRGPNYRMRPVQPFALSNQKTNDRAGAYVTEMVEAALDKFAKDHEESHGIAPYVFTAWGSAIVDAAKQACNRLTSAEKSEILRWEPTHVGWSVAAGLEARRLQRHYVVQPADKETGTITITCKVHWEQQLLREAHQTPTYELAGGGAATHLSRDPISHGVASAIVAQRAMAREQQQRARRRTRWMSRVPLAMQVSHTDRVLRARHEFGVLAIAIGERIPSDARVARMAFEVQSRLQREHSTPASSVAEEAKRDKARQRVQGAVRLLQDRDSRADLWSTWVRRGRPVVRILRCPIDVPRLRAYVASDDSLAMFAPKQWKGQAAGVRRTGRSIVAEFLDQVVTPNGEDADGYIDISYRHSRAGMQLVDAGFVTESREYAIGADPFKLRKKLRAMALGRFGLDMDDSASFPRAGCYLINHGRARASEFLVGRKEILVTLGRYFFPQLDSDDTRREKRRDLVKLLFNLLDMDGTVESWLNSEADEDGSRIHEWRASGATVDGAPCVPLLNSDGTSTGRFFNLAAYVAEQPERSAEVARRMPLAGLMVQHLNEAMGRSQKQHERTLKSYVFQEAEGVSRRAKLDWCLQHGCLPINLQHDGVVVRLTAAWDASAAMAELSQASSAALGYSQPVEVKPWPAGIVFVEQLPAPYVCSTAVDNCDSCESVLRTQFAYLQSRGMIPRRWGGGMTRERNEQGEKESAEESFLHRYAIPYLYGLVKTHKWPYGWRFISGGANLALNLVGDWVHLALQSLQQEIHRLAASALAGALESDPMPCAESFVIRDSRDVVRRIKDLARRREKAWRAHREEGAARPPHWRRVQFEVADFTTLYPTLSHQEILVAISSLVNRIFGGHRKTKPEEQWIRVVKGSTGVGKATWTAGTRKRGRLVPPSDERAVRHFSAEQLMADVRFILNHAYVTVGDELFRQRLGVPMGLSCSPGIAVTMLAYYEIRMLESMRRAAEGPLGGVIDTHRGQVPLTPAVRVQHLDLACRLSRCCRAIDDVLFMDMTRGERQWAKAKMYPGSLELKTVCQSPQPIQYLDLEVRHDRGGFYTRLYDKRDELQAAGKMGAVRRFPHVSAILSEQCKYGCLVSFLHRARRCCMRQRRFESVAAMRMKEMYADGYVALKLVQKMRAFLRANHQPSFRWKAVAARVEQQFERLRADVTQAATVDLFPEGTRMEHSDASGRGQSAAAEKSQQARDPTGSTGRDRAEATAESADDVHAAEAHPTGSLWGRLLEDARDGTSERSSEPSTDGEESPRELRMQSPDEVEQTDGVSEAASGPTPAEDLAMVAVLATLRRMHLEMLNGQAHRVRMTWRRTLQPWSEVAVGVFGMGGVVTETRDANPGLTVLMILSALIGRLDGRSMDHMRRGLPKGSLNDSLVYCRPREGPQVVPAETPMNAAGNEWWRSWVVCVVRERWSLPAGAYAPSRGEQLTYPRPHMAKVAICRGMLILRLLMGVPPEAAGCFPKALLAHAARWTAESRQWAPTALWAAARQLAVDPRSCIGSTRGDVGELLYESVSSDGLFREIAHHSGWTA